MKWNHTRNFKKFKSVKIIDPNSEAIATRNRFNKEKIEDKLIRDGMRIQQKKLKLIEETTKSNLKCMSPKAELKNKLDYKKILYPASKLKEKQINFDLDEISKIQSRHEIIHRLFMDYKQSPRF